MCCYKMSRTLLYLVEIVHKTIKVPNEFHGFLDKRLEYEITTDIFFDIF